MIGAAFGRHPLKSDVHHSSHAVRLGQRPLINFPPPAGLLLSQALSWKGKLVGGDSLELPTSWV
jgi:hypothetical protein